MNKAFVCIIFVSTRLIGGAGSIPVGTVGIFDVIFKITTKKYLIKNEICQSK